MPKALAIGVPRRPHGVRYPWREWFAKLADGSSLILTQGKDFLCEPASFGINARLAGSRLGVIVKAKVSGQQVCLTKRI